MQDHDSTARSRELGDELRRVREATGLNGSQLARKLGWSQSRISRLESGKRGASELDVAVFLAVCGVTGLEQERLLELCRDVYAQTWVQMVREPRTPGPSQTLLTNEARATTIVSYEPLLVPGLLQTEDYARTTFHWTGMVPQSRIKHLTQVRMSRQAILRKPAPPSAHFYIGEHALHASAGRSRLMNEQLLHLALVATRPRCTIQVVPASAGPYGSLGGAFYLMEFADCRLMVTVDNLNCRLLLEETEDIAAYRSCLERLAAVALNEQESRELLVRLANDCDILEDPYEIT